MFLSIIDRLTSFATGFARNDSGADLVEYSILTALFALVGFLGAATFLFGQMGPKYQAWDTAQQDLWIPPAPAGS
jgi:Flp pilus assembly pilin Flp